MEHAQHLSKVLILGGMVVLGWLYAARKRNIVPQAPTGHEAPFYQTYNTWPVPVSSIVSALPPLAAGLQNVNQDESYTLSQVIL